MAEQQPGSNDDGGNKPGSGISLGFSIKGKARAKVAVHVAEKQEERQLVTAVTADGTIKTTGPAAGSSAGQKQFVVPALQNTYKAGVGKFVPSFVPESSTAAVTGNAEDKYERAEVGHAPQLTSFGLEVRRPKDPAAAAAGADEGTTAVAAAAANGGAGGSGAAVAGLVAAKQAGAGGRADEAAQLRADLETLPEEATVEVRAPLSAVCRCIISS